MNWEAISAAAEILGSVAVVVTLLFVVTQLRHSASTMANSTLQSALNADVDIMTHLISDQELYSIYHRGIRSTETLTKEERGRFEILMLVMFRMVDSQYRQYKNGGADEEYWASLVITTQEHFRMPGVYASWQRQKSVLTSGFVALVDSWNVTHK
ncbi:MAG: hypothetical protein V7709_20275 [Halioglobus sp.]